MVHSKSRTQQYESLQVTKLQEKFDWEIITHPKVGVIIPHYNYSDLLEDAILSVLQQTYHNYEIIVVDDYSDPNEREDCISIIQKIKKSLAPESAEVLNHIMLKENVGTNISLF